MKPNILLLEPIHLDAINELKNFANVDLNYSKIKNQYLKLINKYEIIIIKSGILIDQEFIHNSRKLKILCRAGSGLDNISLELLKKNNIELVHANKLNSRSSAEFVVGLIIGLTKNIFTAIQNTKSDVFNREDLLGREIRNLTIGIIGIGSVGLIVSELLRPFKCRVLGFDINLKNKNLFTKNRGLFCKNVETVLKKSDVISLHMSLNKSTQGFFDEDKFRMLKKNCFFINTSRAKVIDDVALTNAIKEKRIQTACLDVIDPEPKYTLKKQHPNKFSKIKNIYLTPHLAAMTDDCQRQIGNYISKRIINFIKKNY